jgi:predicted CXXCH cytochrome family protein
MIAAILIALSAGLLSGADNDAGRIMRPTDGAALASGEVDIIATAPSGKLTLDGKDIVAEQPFPNVFHALVKVGPGLHSLALAWEGGKKEIRFFSGDHPPAGFAAFHQHPPLAEVACTQCHEVNKRGRFRFKGGCFECHQQQGFVKIHTHDAARLEQCGMCHNAHGSTVKALLLYPKETACKMCHS